MFICHLLVVYYYQGFLPTHLPLSSFHPCALVVETVVFMQFSAILCRTLPHFANPCIIVELECRGKQIVFLSQFLSFISLRSRHKQVMKNVVPLLSLIYNSCREQQYTTEHGRRSGEFISTPYSYMCRHPYKHKQVGH